MNKNSSFDCQAMPEEVKDLFFDTYRQPNNTKVSIYVAEELEPIRTWLIENGADPEDEVEVKYHWVEEKPTKLFSYKDYRSEDDEDFFID